MRWLRLENRWFSATTRGGRTGWRRGFEIFGLLFAFERSNLFVRRELYMERWLFYVASYTLRLHKFYRGDDDKASHTHPWWFITFPLSPYFERMFDRGKSMGSRVVKAFRFHYRPATFEHYVAWGLDLSVSRLDFVTPCYIKRKRPFYTIVITGRVLNPWGFYPFDRNPRVFVPHEKWT